MFTEPEPEFLKDEIRLQLDEIKGTYMPGYISSDYVSNKVFTGIIGPFGIGKSSITDEIASVRPTIAPINTTTTRNRKPEDPPGFKTADEGVTFESMRDDANDGRLINYSVIKKGHIYGTLAEDFTSKYNMGPLLPSSIEQLSKAGFGELHFVYIVAPGELWKGFVNKSRRNMPPESFQIRVEEAIDSIKFALANIAILKFVENTEGKAGIRKAAQEIREITFNNATPILPAETAQQYLNEMLAVAEAFALE